VRNFLIIFSCLICSSAQAFTLEWTGTNDDVIAAINGYELNGQLYDIDFVWASYNELAAQQPDGFLTEGLTVGEGNALVTDINSIITSNGAKGVGNCDQVCSVYRIVRDKPNGAGNIPTVFGHEFEGDWLAGPITTNPTWKTSYAVFSVAVPVPAAVFLFPSALMALGFLRLRRCVLAQS
jgi:hypothetical protein